MPVHCCSLPADQVAVTEDESPDQSGGQAAGEPADQEEADLLGPDSLPANCTWRHAAMAIIRVLAEGNGLSRGTGEPAWARQTGQAEVGWSMRSWRWLCDLNC